MTVQQATAGSPVRDNPLLTQPVAVLIRRIGIPVGIGAFFNTMFNVVDTFYGGAISDQALAALSLSFPIFFIIIALSYGLASGNTALIGNALGNDEPTNAERFAVQGIVFGVLLSLIVTAIGLAIASPLYQLMGASGDYLAMGMQYIVPIFCGTIFFVVVQMLNSLLNARGKTKPNRNFLVTGFFLNLLLDPWFIFGGVGVPAMGITGIALATVLVQILGCIYLSYEVAKMGVLTRESWRQHGWPQPKIMSQIGRQGFPNIIDMSSISIGFFILTVFVSRFGQGAVAAFGAASRIEQLAMLPLIGLDVAALSLIAQNNGAGLRERIREIVDTAIRYGVIVMLVGAIIITLLATILMDAFSNDPEIIRLGATYVRIKAWALLPTAFLFISFAGLRGLKRPVDALILSMMRMVILPVLLLYPLIVVMGYGLNAIWWVTFATAFLVGGAAYWHMQRQLG